MNKFTRYGKMLAADLQDNALDAWIAQGRAGRFIVPAVMVDKNLASAMLQHNTANRRVSPSQVAFYAEEMRAGKWAHSLPIMFASTGRLIDGQHRLLAVVSSEAKIVCDLVFGADEALFDRVDVGMPRTNAQIIAMAGMKSAAEVASISSALIVLRRIVDGENPNTKIPRHEVLSQASALPHLPQVSSWVALMKAGLGRVRSIGGLGAALCLIMDEWAARNDAVDIFVRRVANGLNINDIDDPIHALRRRLMSTQSSIATVRSFRQIEVAVIVIKAFNAWATGMKLHTLVYRPEGALPVVVPISETRFDGGAS